MTCLGSPVMKNTISYEVKEATSSPLPAGFLAQLPEVFSREGQTIYKGRNEIKKFEINGRTVCVKKYCIPPLINRILYSLGWRTPKAKRTYDNAQEILKRGFKTPVQYGYVLRKKNGWLEESFSVGEFVAQARTVGEDKKDTGLVSAFARYTADLHAHGLMHRDYILNNILYTHDENGYDFTLIDINRFVFRQKPIRGFLQSMNLMQPFHDAAELKRFVSAYEEAACCPGKLTGRVVRFRWWRNRYSQLKRLLRKIQGSRFFTRHGR